MNRKHTPLISVQPLLDMLSSGEPVAVTAPLMLEDQFFVGYCSADSSDCAAIPATDAYTLSRMLYQPTTSAGRDNGRVLLKE
jgi:hypothetical protein